MWLWGITDRGSVRKENQDAYVCRLLEGTGIGIVCDGMGGAKAGNVASRLAAETFLEELDRDTGPSGWGARMDAAAIRANERVYQRSVTEEDCRGMGTTLVAAVVEGEQVFVLNVGDSRCYLVDAESIVQVTRDHSLVEDMVARGDITPEQARFHPRKNLITRALGVEETVHCDLFTLERREGTFLLLCSDGLSNMVSDPELLYEIIHGDGPETCCRRLLDIALSRGAPDNVTAVLMQL